MEKLVNKEDSSLFLFPFNKLNGFGEDKEFLNLLFYFIFYLNPIHFHPNKSRVKHCIVFNRHVLLPTDLSKGELNNHYSYCAGMRAEERQMCHIYITPLFLPIQNLSPTPLATLTKNSYVCSVPVSSVLTWGKMQMHTERVLKVTKGEDPFLSDLWIQTHWHLYLHLPLLILVRDNSIMMPKCLCTVVSHHLDLGKIKVVSFRRDSLINVLQGCHLGSIFNIFVRSKFFNIRYEGSPISFGLVVLELMRAFGARWDR
jgi:hypothetical protein